jgi:hypothetical protein
MLVRQYKDRSWNMKIIHRVSFHPKHHPKAKKRFLQLGIELEELFMHGDPKYSLGCSFDISEDEPVWPQASETIKKYNIPTIPRVEFTKEEVLSAEWVSINPIYFDEDLYPEPHEEHQSWQKASFDYENTCYECGIGLRQKAPIRLKREPNLKDNDFISIFWIYAIFARPEVLDIMMKNNITGFESFPAINHSSDMSLKTIKQMKIINELPPALIADNLKRADAERMTTNNSFTHEPYPCGHVKYYGTDSVVMKYKREIFANCPDLVRTSEWFGTGHAALQLVLASSKFVELYFDKGWKGLSLSPIELK